VFKSPLLRRIRAFQLAISVGEARYRRANA